MKNSKGIIKFGERLKELRKQAGILQKDLAYEAGIDVATIRRIEKGEHPTSLDTILSLAEALEISPAKFFQD